MTKPLHKLPFSSNEQFQKFDPKSKWIIYKLLKDGFKFLNSSDNVIWLYYNRTGFLNSTDLVIGVKNNDYQQKATFRPTSEVYIHVTAYLRLGTMTDWEILEKFKGYAEKYERTLDP